MNRSVLDWSERNVLITGGSRGIGRALTKLLRELECGVFTFGSAECDLRSAQRTIYYISSIGEKFDALVNNAGVFCTSPTIDLGLMDWDECFKVNVTAPFLIIRTMLRLHLFKPNAVILNVNSIDRMLRPINQLAYNCSKAALEELTLSLGKELEPHGIYVCDVRLPSVDTDMVKMVNRANPMPNIILDPLEAAHLIRAELEEAWHEVSQKERQFQV